MKNMQLQDLKTSITKLPRSEVLLIHREIRKNRFISKLPTKKKQVVKQQTKAMKEIKSDPEKIKTLLRLLGEDV